MMRNFYIIILIFAKMCCFLNSSSEHEENEQFRDKWRSKIYRRSGLVTWTVKRVLEQTRPYMKDNEPLVIAQLDNSLEVLSEENANVTLDMTDIKVYNISTFDIISMKNTLRHSTLNAEMSWNQLKIVNDYTLSGFLFGYNVTGKGVITTKLTDLNMKLQVKYKMRLGVQITELKLLYNCKNVDIGITGLHSDDITPGLLKMMFEAASNLYVKEQREEISYIMSEEIKPEINRLLYQARITNIPFLFIQYIKSHLKPAVKDHKNYIDDYINYENSQISLIDDIHE